MLAPLALSLALQSAPFPGAVQPDPIDHPDWWVPCSSSIAIERGLGCTAPTPAPVPTAPAPEPLPVDCDPVPNPYLEPDRAARCAAWTAERQPARPLPTFNVPTVYRDPYGREPDGRVVGDQLARRHPGRDGAADGPRRRRGLQLPDDRGRGAAMAGRQVTTRKRPNRDGDASRSPGGDVNLRGLRLLRVPDVRPLPVERLREILGPKAEAMSDAEVHEIGCVIARQVTLAFEIASTAAQAPGNPTGAAEPRTGTTE